MRYAAGALGFLVLAACVDSGLPPEELASCSEQGGYESLIGKSADILAAMTFPSPVRIIRPGMAVTMDYNPDRLNIEIDGNNRIIRVWCG